MPLVQSIDGARAERVGPHGVDRQAYDDALARSAGARDWLKARHADGKLPLLRLPEKRARRRARRRAPRRLPISSASTRSISRRSRRARCWRRSTWREAVENG